MKLSKSDMVQVKGGYILTCEEKKHYNKLGTVVTTEFRWYYVEDGSDQLTSIVDITSTTNTYEKMKKISPAIAKSLM
jgi:alpha-glucosidase (family GH31 glycosyl hydrolase)